MPAFPLDLMGLITCGRCNSDSLVTLLLKVVRRFEMLKRILGVFTIVIMLFLSEKVVTWADVSEYDDLEPNNTIETSQLLITSKAEKHPKRNYFQISPDDSMDIFHFELKERKDVDISIRCNLGDGPDYRFIMMLTKNKTFSYGELDDTQYLTSSLDYCWKRLEPGTYYIGFWCVSSSGEVVDYTISLNERECIIDVEGIELNKQQETLWTKKEYGKNSVKLKAKVSPSDATNPDVTWKSRDEKVVTVSEDGTVTAVSVGATVVDVMAQDGSGIVASCNISVKVPIPKIQCNSTVKLGAQLTATADYAGGKWTTSDKSVIKIVSTKGKKAVLKGLTPGVANLKYVLNGVKSNVISVKVKAPVPVIKGKTKLNQNATTTFTVDIEGGKWISSNGSVVKVISTGKKSAVLKGKKAGTACITYVANGVTSNKIYVTVKEKETEQTPVSTDPVIEGPSSMKVGKSVIFRLNSGKEGGKWYSSDATVVVITKGSDGTTCTGIGQKAGTVKIYYVVDDKKSNEIQVVVKGL